MKRLVLVLVLLLTAVDCRGTAPGERCPETDAGAPVDPALFAFLSRARAAHHAADALEAKGDTAGAVRALEAVAEGRLPPRADAPEVREVLADTLARLADLASRSGAFDRAEQHLARGLGLARETTYFRGHLFEVRGLVEERRSKALQASGDTQGESAARDRALAAFEEAMRIQEAVIEQATRPP